MRFTAWHCGTLLAGIILAGDERMQRAYFVRVPLSLLVAGSL
jgi:hypothetical protein